MQLIWAPFELKPNHKVLAFFSQICKRNDDPMEISLPHSIVSDKKWNKSFIVIKKVQV